ncbi:MAG: ATP-binding cassette domain-containing protein [Planctomycetota bacterium]
MNADSPALELRAVTQRYPRWLGLAHDDVLRGIDLTLARGHVLGLAGPNGSGKSTLLRIVAGIDRASSGDVRVLGGSPLDAGVRRRVGYLPEESPFPREMSARTCLDLLGSLSDMPRAERRRECERLLELVGLRERARTALGRYSRGMLRRFGLAQAWLARPELVLLDEPTAGLDAPGFEVLAALLAEARARGASVVVASHVVADMRETCDDMAVIQGGVIAHRGAPRDVLAERTLRDLYRTTRTSR